MIDIGVKDKKKSIYCGSMVIFVKAGLETQVLGDALQSKSEAIELKKMRIKICIYKSIYGLQHRPLTP